MKKIVCLLIALSLTAALFSCTDKLETKQEEAKTPEVTETLNETATPNEQDITTPETPETVTPTEPETAEPDENVVVLPEADENTKYITIEFPEDFPEEPYVEPNLVSPKEFEWGEYVPFVKIETVGYNASQGVVSYAIYSEDTIDTKDARALYSKLNSKYLIENKVTKTDSLSNNSDVYNFLSQSQIIEVSPDLSFIQRLYFLEKGEVAKDTYYSSIPWTCVYETLINGTVTNIIYTENAFEYPFPFFPLYSYRYESMSDQKMILRYSNYAYKIYDDYINGKSYVHSTLDNRLAYVIDIKGNIGVCQITYMSDNYILFNTSKKDSKEFEGCAYLYDIKNEMWTLLENYTEYPVISPDGKYLAYTTWHYYDVEVSEEDSKYSQTPGVYIKNLENNTTVHFENEYRDVCVNGWIEKNALENAINT